MTDTRTQTGIAVHASFMFLNWMLFLMKPTIVVDGQAQKGTWGDNFVATSPGSHEVEVYFKYFFTNAGKSKTTVNVAEGQTVNLRYRAPFWLIFLKGKLTTA